MITNPHMLPKIRSQAIRDACEGMPCTLMLGTFIGRPCSDKDTVVGGHLPVDGKGMSTKVTDLAIAAGCHACHDMLDDRNQHGRFIRQHYPLAYGLQLLKALTRTQAYLVDADLIYVPGSETI